MIVSIDPGASGAIAFLDDDGTLIDVVDMPVVEKQVAGSLLRDILTQYGGPPADAIVERVASMPRQGVASTFKFGCAYGTALGVIAALGIPVHHVTPTVWKRAMGVTADKETSRHKAIDRWPHQAGLFARKKDDGRAEAALIGLWWLES